MYRLEYFVIFTEYNVCSSPESYLHYLYNNTYGKVMFCSFYTTLTYYLFLQTLHPAKHEYYNNFTTHTILPHIYYRTQKLDIKIGTRKMHLLYSFHYHNFMHSALYDSYPMCHIHT